MWIKLLGICLVCVSCAGIGGGEALRLIGRRRFLEEVKRIAAGLQGEIGYTQAVLPLALCRAVRDKMLELKKNLEELTE